MSEPGHHDAADSSEIGAGKTVAIVQSNYIPWKGYFDLIAAVDEFVLYDDRQYTRRDWRNRNRIKTSTGAQWLTIPVEVKGRYQQRICDTRIHDFSWAEKHWQQILHAYRRAPYFERYRDRIEALYRTTTDHWLSQVNHKFITEICDILGIKTRISWSMDYQTVGGKSENLVNLCGQCGASRYISGPAARDYIDATLFDDAGIELDYFDYSGYREYPQLYGEFEHGVTVLDLIFNVGPDAPRYMKCVNPRR